MSAQPQIAPIVSAAIAELENEYDQVFIEPDGSGGAYIAVAPVIFGERWSPETDAVEFAAPYNYPYAAIYPFYTSSVLQRTDGAEWPNALQRVTWRGREVIQISLRTRRWEPAHDTASTALRMVAHWFQSVA